MSLTILLSSIAHITLIGIARAGHGMPPCTYPLWVSGTEYCAGENVQHNGIQYTSLWCTLEEPGTGNEYDGWDTLGACVPTSPSPTASASPTPSQTGTPTPVPTTTTTPTPSTSTVPTPAPGSPFVVGYFASWKVYYDFYFKNLVTSESAALLTHIVYAFGGVNPDSTCYSVDPEADTDKIFTSANSVDGSDDAWNQPLRGNFNQILQLKRLYPHIKVLWSFGGWTLSENFGIASQNADVFADSCYNLVFDERFKDTDGTTVFDGIDIDWEYPNACGNSCDNSGPQAYATLLTALRKKFGEKLVTSAITGDGQTNGKIDSTDYAAGAEQLDFMMVMTYDYFGAFDSDGPTAPHAPLLSYEGIPIPDMYAAKGIQKLKSQGVPSEKLLLGIPFYGRGWSGVSLSTPGGSATGPAPGIEPGVENYNILKDSCPHTGFVAGTSYSYCSPYWWSYDTPKSISFKTAYAARETLGGVFTWELSGDTEDAELLKAMAQGLRSRFGMSPRCLATNNHYRA